MRRTALAAILLPVVAWAAVGCASATGPPSAVGSSAADRVEGACARPAQSDDRRLEPDPGAWHPVAVEGGGWLYRDATVQLVLLCGRWAEGLSATDGIRLGGRVARRAAGVVQQVLHDGRPTAVVLVFPAAADTTMFDRGVPVATLPADRSEVPSCRGRVAGRAELVACGLLLRVELDLVLAPAERRLVAAGEVQYVTIAQEGEPDALHTVNAATVVAEGLRLDLSLVRPFAGSGDYEVESLWPTGGEQVEVADPAPFTVEAAKA